MKKMTFEKFREYRQEIRVESYKTGDIEADKRVYTQPGEDGPITGRSVSVINAFSLEHPVHGDIMIDAGFSSDFFIKPPFGNLNFIMRTFQRLNNITYMQSKNEDIIFQLNKEHVVPKKVLLTHMHPDHTSGIPYFDKDIEILFGKEEDTFYYNMLVKNHIKGRTKRLIDFEQYGVEFCGFDKVVDVFGDLTVLAVSTKGHTKDHIAYLVNGDKPYFIVGDAELTEEDAKEGIYINSDYGKQGEADTRKSADRIRAFAKMYPEVELLYSHS